MYDRPVVKVKFQLYYRVFRVKMHFIIERIHASKLIIVNKLSNFLLQTPV